MSELYTCEYCLAASEHKEVMDAHMCNLKCVAVQSKLIAELEAEIEARKVPGRNLYRELRAAQESTQIVLTRARRAEAALEQILTLEKQALHSGIGANATTHNICVLALKKELKQ